MKKGIEYADMSWNASTKVYVSLTHSLFVIKMNDDYIAGMFDGEGSGMIITVKRNLNTGTVFRFRPVIKISQNDRKILDKMREHLHYGHVSKTGMRCHNYVINGLESVISFVERIADHCYIKRDILYKVKELADYQKARGNSNKPYTLDETMVLIDIRDQVFNLNQKNRIDLKQKYPKETILQETTFYTDKEWLKIRTEIGKANVKHCHKTIRKKREKKECECGCGGLLTTPNKYGRDKRFIQGHNQKGKKWKWNR